MDQKLLQIKTKELLQEVVELFQLEKYTNTYLSDTSPDKLIFEEVLRILSYLDWKKSLTTATLENASSIFKELLPYLKWDEAISTQSLKSSIQDFQKNHIEKLKQIDSEISIPKVLEIAKEYDEFFFTEKYQTISLKLIQFFDLIIQSDGKITPFEESFLKRYAQAISKSQYLPFQKNQDFAKALSKIYDDFFGYAQKLEEIKQDKETTLKQTNSNLENKPNIPAKQEKEPTLEELLEELNSLVGLEKVKSEIQNLINVLKIEKIRKEKGLGVLEKSLHMVFTGNPGTGKTTVARILAKIFKTLGILNKGHLVETDRTGLVAGYVGQTAIKTTELCKQALDGVLFIDEAYSLSEGGENDFGKEAINTLLKFMEDNRTRLIVIVAGYTQNMEKFISKNPGLKSRFNIFIHFEDYTPEQLLEIFEKMTKKMKLTLTQEAKDVLIEIFQKEYEKRDEKFGNARFARNLFEKVYRNQANRLVQLTELKEEDLCKLEKEDITLSVSYT
ncbi:MAG: AAA family ATPase, partial [Leptospiraceae bacterium]|nr:AAA family ATPase [Leptospiraceae bacterium]